MKYFSTIALLVLIKYLSFAQNQSHQYNIMQAHSPASDSKIIVAENGDTVLVSKYVTQNPQNNSRLYVEKTYKGTPFFKNGWYPGTLYFNDGTSTNGTLAYNLVNNLVYFSLGSAMDAAEAKPLAFTIGGQTLSKLNEKYNNTNAGYFEMVFGGPKLDLFRQYSCYYHSKLSGERTGYEAEGGLYEGTYDKSVKLFLGFNNQVVELKSNKNIYKQFNEYRNAMEKYGKENKLNFKKEPDIIKLVAYFSMLLDKFEK